MTQLFPSRAGFALRVAGAGIAVSLLAPLGAGAALTAVQPYAVPVGGQYSITPLLSAGDVMPETGAPGKSYRMVGIPDGLGAHLSAGNMLTVYLNHELGASVVSEPLVGRPQSRGAFVSKFIMDGKAQVISGKRAFDWVYYENAYVGPAAASDNQTPAFSRFCSGSLAGAELGFDRPIYFAGEESGGSDTFDGVGGLGVAIADDRLYALPKLGRFAKENVVAMPGTGDLTVLMALEDGPAGLDSQLYMYVGQKDGRPGAGFLARNGLDNGRLYVFAGANPARNSEKDVASGVISGRWVEIPGAEFMTAGQLNDYSVRAAAFGFVRIEDGAFNKNKNTDFFFVTTGGSKESGNELGRLYQVRLSQGDPRGWASLQVVYNADQIIAGGGDIAVSPDNIDVNDRYIMVQEDGTAESRPVMGAKKQDGSIWRFSLAGDKDNQWVDAGSALRVAELKTPGRDGAPVNPAGQGGIWETSGIIDASPLYGPDRWLFVVQAHRPTKAPAGATVEDGQLLIMGPAVR